MSTENVRHTVFMKFRDDASEEDIQSIFKSLEELLTKKLIPGMLSLSWGAHDSNEGLNQGFTYGASMVFESIAHRDAYLPHPEHQRVVGLIQPLLKDGVNSLVVLDWVLRNEVIAS